MSAARPRGAPHDAARRGGGDAIPGTFYAFVIAHGRLLEKVYPACAPSSRRNEVTVSWIDSQVFDRSRNSTGPLKTRPLALPPIAYDVDLRVSERESVISSWSASTLRAVHSFLLIMITLYVSEESPEVQQVRFLLTVSQILLMYI